MNHSSNPTKIERNTITQKNPLIAVQDLSITFHKGRQPIRAVKHISFDIQAGTTVGLVGESGSGKTTTGRAIAKIGPISGGDVLFRGKSTNHFSRKERSTFRRQVQMIFQDPFESLNPRQKVSDTIAEGIDNFKLASSRKDRLDQIVTLLDQVGLPRDAINRFPHEFSGGQRQRIGIARALAVQPQFLILDEPISSLDVSIQAQIVNLLKAIQEEKKLTYLFIAHDLSMVHYISDKIVVMYQGRIVEAGSADKVYYNPLHPYTQALLSSVPQADPIYEQQKKIITFSQQNLRSESILVEERPNHWVLRN